MTDEDTDSGDDGGDDVGGSVIASWSRRRKVGVAVLVVAVVLIGVFLFLSQPAPTEPDVEPSEKNTELYLTLADASITDAVVDITDERALVRYNVPEEMTKNESVYYTLGATATVADDSESIVLEVYRNNEGDERVTVSTEAVREFVRNESSLSDLQNEIERTDL